MDLLRANVDLFGARSAIVLLQTLGTASLVTLIACAIGVPLGISIGRFDVIGRGPLWALHAFPVAIPPFLLALGFSDAGALPRGNGGVVLVLVVALAPIATSLVALASRSVDAPLEDAARAFATPLRVATHVVFPACRPALGLAAVAIFALAFSELGVPMFLRTDAYPVYVLSRLGGVDWSPGEAAALAMPLVLVTLLVFAAERVFVRADVLAGRMARAERPPMPLRRRTLASVAAWAIALVGLVPLAGLLAKADVPKAMPWLGDAPRNSVVASVIAATIITITGFLLAHAKARIVSALAILAFVLPSSMLGVGLVAAWNRPATQLVYGTIAMVALGFVARYAVIGIAASRRALASVPAHLDESARVFGAGFGSRMLRVLFPASAREMIGAWLLAVVFCLRDLETPVLFYPPGSEPLTVRIFTLEANGSPGVIAALALIQIAMAAAVCGLGWIAWRGLR
jgi:ABC-type Fe3+ transport system permease subunit